MDHILPLFVALGAGGSGAGQRLHQSTTYGVIAMDAYSFGAAA
jgi:4,5-DOPA dioxygenase extradiol